jgi:hypothetical protein
MKKISYLLKDRNTVEPSPTSRGFGTGSPLKGRGLLRLEIGTFHLNIQPSCSPSLFKGGVGEGSTVFRSLSRYKNIILNQNGFSTDKSVNY